MNLDWQTIVAIGLVGIAAVYLVFRGWRVIARKRAGGCGACASCPSQPTNDSLNQRSFVSIDHLSAPAIDTSPRSLSDDSVGQAR